MNGFARAAAGREHREQSLQFVCVKPQAVAARTAVESQWQAPVRAGDRDFVEPPVAAGTEVCRAARDNALSVELEAFYVDLLSLGQRLDWVQLASLLRTTGDTHTVGEFAHRRFLGVDVKGDHAARP